MEEIKKESLLKQTLQENRDSFNSNFNSRIGSSFECIDAEMLMTDLQNWHEQKLKDYTQKIVEMIDGMDIDKGCENLYTSYEGYKYALKDLKNKLLDKG